MQKLNPKVFSLKYLKSTFTKSVISISKAKTIMVRAEPMTTCTAGIDTYYSTRFNMLLVSQTKHYVYGQSWIWFDCQNSYNRAFAAGGKVPQGQRFPTWGTCTPGDTFAYPKGYICLSKGIHLPIWRDTFEVSNRSEIYIYISFISKYLYIYTRIS